MALDPHMRFRFIRGFFVGVHTSKGPTNEAWTAHCAEVERLRNETRGVLVYTEGGGPNSRQRQQLRAALHELEAPRTAIVTASPLVRGIVIGLNWFFRAPRIAAFAPDAFDEAFAYVATGGASVPREEILHAIRLMADELGVTLPAGTSARTPPSESRAQPR